jgi:hypothetical protein
MKRATLARIAPLWVCGLVVASLQPWRPGLRHDGAVHDALHFLAFFSTALVLALVRGAGGAGGRPHEWGRGTHECVRHMGEWAPGFAVVALGAAIEYAQHLLYRGTFEWGDLASDACAALLACLVARFRPLREALVT